MNKTLAVLLTTVVLLGVAVWYYLESADNKPLDGNVAVSAVQSYVANVENIERDAVTILNVTQQDWSDTCLGLGGPAESCLVAITPGFSVTVSIGGVEQTFRTDSVGSDIRREPDTTNLDEPADLEAKIPFSGRDGAHLGFIHEVDLASNELAFDDAVWLTGVEAQDAAIEAGYCTESNRSECTPNGYFIKNASKVDETILIDETASFYMQTWKMEETGEVTTREISYTEFADLVNNTDLHWRQLPYTITVYGGRVTKVEEVYIP